MFCLFGLIVFPDADLTSMHSQKYSTFYKRQDIHTKGKNSNSGKRKSVFSYNIINNKIDKQT